MTIIDLVLGLLLLVVIFLLIILIRRSHISSDQIKEINLLREALSRSEQAIKGEVKSNQETILNTLTHQMKNSSDTLVNTLKVLGDTQTEKLSAVTESINTLTESNENRFENVRNTLNERLNTLQKSNEKKIDEMRSTVDEKLQSTLEKRLTASFKVVSERLEAVREGLGKMENLASNVGSLQRVLTNVSTRGTWGEVQLNTILEDILTPDQYGVQVKPHKGTEIVDFAIKLPGDSEDSDQCVWLPIDSKFPLADYERLIDAVEIADKEAEQNSVKQLNKTLQSEAKSISEKYIAPPHTTDFAIMFLPTESLYAEILRQPGQIEELLQRYRVVVAGPTNLAAILISLRVGFRTLAIQEHSAEIKNVLAAVKTEFDKFSGIMDKLHRQLNTATNTVYSTGVRTRAMARHLKDIEKLPQDDVTKIIGFSEIELENENQQ